MTNRLFKSSDLIKKFYREKDVKNIQDKLSMLGSGTKMDAVTYLNFKTIFLILLFFGILFLSKYGYILAPIVTIVTYLMLDYFLIESGIKKRISLLDREALHFFEILTLTLESGRNLEHALEVTCFNVDSELSFEFKKTLFEMKFGKSLIEALEGMKKRIPSETVGNIILNITQTNVFGNSIIDTMYQQIEFLREKQLLEIKEQINKIPNKVSIISVLFILPLILILIIVPFLINFLG